MQADDRQEDGAGNAQPPETGGGVAKGGPESRVGKPDKAVPLGMPLTPEELRRLKKEAERPNPSAESVPGQPDE